MGQSWQAILAGALHALTDPGIYEQVDGLTPEQTAAVFSEMWFAFDGEKGCPMFAGMIVAAARSSAPAGWLACDGAAYSQDDYQTLYDAIGVAFGDDGAGTFRVPDMRSRLPIGVGQGAGLTSRAMADDGGEESHALTVNELPSHRHYVDIIVGPESGGTIPGVAQLFRTIDAGNLYTNYEGGNASHNTMPPFLALQFFIYAGA